MQVIALAAMEPTAGDRADDLRDRKVEVFRAMPDADPQRYVRGQYEAYRGVAGVEPASTTETFVALRLDIDNWRWAGVPFFIRAGKALAGTVTELRIVFRRPPRLAFVQQPGRPEPNQLILRLDPDPALQLVLQAKGVVRGTSAPVHLDLRFAEELGSPPEPYERVLDAAIRGDGRLFAREDSVEETWRILQPLLDAPPPVQAYPVGSFGPPAAEEIVRGYPGWHHPWMAERADRGRADSDLVAVSPEDVGVDQGSPDASHVEAAHLLADEAAPRLERTADTRSTSTTSKRDGPSARLAHATEAVSCSDQAAP
jgi:glucose-6-phosphate 1-dehydrogenase